MFRILKAFAWMRWRIFVNTLQNTSGRDAVQRLSLAIERLAPILMLVIFIPSALALTGLSAFVGYLLATGGSQQVLFQVVRYLLFAGTLAAIVGPLVVPTGDRTNPVRLLLLPIPARTLYVAQAGAALVDPWIFLHIPVVVALPAGLVAGGAVSAAALALVAGAGIALVVVGIAAFVTTAMHLLLRDRRRGELIALVLLIVLPMVGFLPSLVGIDRRSRRERPPAAEQQGQEQQDPQSPAEEPRQRRARPTPLPPWLVSAGGRVFSVAPSELYASAVRRAATGQTAAAATPMVGLLAMAAAVHAIGLSAFRRVLSSVGTTGPRRATSMHSFWTRVLPGTSPGTSAVALSLVRLAVRTPRGRATLIIPIAFTLMFTLVLARGGAFPISQFGLRDGPTAATFVAFLALLGSLPIVVNQFAVDRAGLTMTLLSPLSTRQVLAGKAIGSGLITLVPAFICILMTAIAFPGGSPALWLALILSVCATFVLISPLAAVLSVLLPRVVNMNSVGSSSNAHALAGFAGMLAFGVAAAPCTLLTLAAVALLGRPMLAPVFVAIWGIAAFVIAKALFRPAERIFDQRRENLTMLM